MWRKGCLVEAAAILVIKLASHHNLLLITPNDQTLPETKGPRNPGDAVPTGLLSGAQSSGVKGGE